MLAANSHGNEILCDMARVLIGCMFFFVGWLWRNSLEDKIERYYDKIGIWLLGLIVGVVISYVNQARSYWGLQFGNHVWYTLLALVSIISWFYCGKNMIGNRAKGGLCFIGQNTIPILCIHQIFISMIRVFERMIFNVTFPYSCSAVLVLACSVVGAKVINKHFAWTLGRYEK